MSTDIYKIKYIKYKKKYYELKKLNSSIDDIVNKIIIIPKEYNVLSLEQQNLFKIYEIDNTSNPISYINKDYLNELAKEEPEKLTDSSSEEQDMILTKNVISPDEYFILADSDKAKYEINESDYDKFPNRVVPKNYKKIIQ
jgi:hypothetical protein